MSIISVVGQKGGVGKSTISRLVAAAAVKSGRTVRICDLDPSQGTTTQWQLRREKCRTVEAALRCQKDTDILVLDGPAFADRLTLAMAKAADLTILPTGYSVDDLTPQIEAAYDLEAKGIDAGKIRLVFCRARGSKNEDAQARRFIKPTGLIVLENALRELPSIRQAHNTGRAANETGFPSVDADAQRLADEILSLL